MTHHLPTRLVQRAALAPWGAGAGRDALDSVIARGGESVLLATILAQGLGPLWSAALSDAPGLGHLSPAASAALDRARLDETARALLQGHTLTQVGDILSTAGIVHAVFKGASLRGYLYPEPGLRPVDDLDILVDPRDRDAAVTALTQAGFRLKTLDCNLSHEADLIRGPVCVDLHWGLFRPGRSRMDLAPLLLRRRRLFRGIWGLDPSAALLVMLVHSAFAKHVSGPRSRLVRQVDLDLLIRHQDPDWDWVLDQVVAAGLAPAAWATLYWQRCLLDTPVPAVAVARLTPGQGRRAYLAHWIDADLPTRLSPVPFLVQGAFTLALHQGPADVLHALAGLLRARMGASRARQALRAAVASASAPGARPGGA